MANRQSETTAALNWYVREWGLVPAMPTEKLYTQAEARLHVLAKEMFGEDNAKAAWDQLKRNRSVR